MHVCSFSDTSVIAAILGSSCEFFYTFYYFEDRPGKYPSTSTCCGDSFHLSDCSSNQSQTVMVPIFPRTELILDFLVLFIVMFLEEGYRIW